MNIWNMLIKAMQKEKDFDPELNKQQVLELEARNLAKNIPSQPYYQAIDPAAVRQLGSEEVNPTTIGYYVDKRGVPARTTFGKDFPVSRYLDQYPRDYVETERQLVSNPTYGEEQFKNWVALQKKLAEINSTKKRSYEK